MIDLDAIRARNEERKRITAMTDAEEDRLRGEGWRDDDFDTVYLNVHDHEKEQVCSADIDALLAEVDLMWKFIRHGEQDQKYLSWRERQTNDWGDQAED